MSKETRKRAETSCTPDNSRLDARRTACYVRIGNFLPIQNVVGFFVPVAQEAERDAGCDGTSHKQERLTF
jgi:hypothetical protein